MQLTNNTDGNYTPRQLKLPLDIDEKGKMTAIEYTIYEQPQPLELENPILENPTTDNPTSENPTQLNKEEQKTGLPKKEKSNTDLLNTDSIPILSPAPSPCEGAAEPPERKRTERNDAYKIYEEIIKENIDNIIPAAVSPMSSVRYALSVFG